MRVRGEFFARRYGAVNGSPVRVWLEHDGALLRVRLARPKANLVDAAMIAALRAAFDVHAGRPGVTAALLDAEGPHFSFGASVEEHLPGQCAAMLAALHGLIVAMLEWPAPILVAIRGQCLGGGLEVALAGTRLFAAPDAALGQPEIRLGVLAPAASCLLPRFANRQVCEDLLFTGRALDGTAALAAGIVAEVAADPAAAACAYFDEHLRGKSTAALAHALRAARAGWLPGFRAHLAAVERIYLDELMRTEDAVEGLRAFLDKRPPQWRHR
jgi:cyclohexa-1,5-dienecarbonyl-CoA hydratase